MDYQFSGGKRPEERVDRNEMLISDYQEHTLRDDGVKVYVYTLAQLMRKYEISDTRIYELLDKNNVPRRERPPKRERKGEAENG